MGNLGLTTGNEMKMRMLEFLIFMFRWETINTDKDLDRDTPINSIDDVDLRIFVAAVETKFKIRFTSDQVKAWTTFGDICDAVESKPHLTIIYDFGTSA